ncbi:hypothetical protein [Photobacterium frigidiphilum]|uniref:hypothetical protein n=1 Tax=Photobacterium frigidiphilum TaxID=264736 RepID=UPI001D131CC8|nr:hypothetical protein [Photobacterium frigidiphilum]
MSGVEPTYTVDKPMQFKGVKLLFSSEGKPEFYANAFTLNRRIVEQLKDTDTTSYRLLSYFRFLAANKLQWNDENQEYQRYPIFLFRGYLDKQITEGKMRRTVGASTMSTIRQFKRHGYIDELPFEVVGYTKYGQMISDCSIQSPTQETQLEPLNGLDLQHVKGIKRDSFKNLE